MLHASILPWFVVTRIMLIKVNAPETRYKTNRGHLEYDKYSDWILDVFTLCKVNNTVMENSGTTLTVNFEVQYQAKVFWWNLVKLCSILLYHEKEDGRGIPQVFGLYRIMSIFAFSLFCLWAAYLWLFGDTTEPTLLFFLCNIRLCTQVPWFFSCNYQWIDAAIQTSWFWQV